MKRILKLIIILCGFALCSFYQKADNQEWMVTSSAVTFKIKNAGFTVDGKFGTVTAKIQFDPSKSYNNSIEATVNAASINTGNSSRDGHLKKKDYFDVEKYPTITLKATTFSKESNGGFKGFFKLSIKDKTKDVVIPFTFTENADKSAFKGSFKINRLDFGVGEKSMILSDNATIEITVNVIKK
jgi:polyisoprenoid-binding protein YceI